jgi:hypothetical protein
LVKLLLSEELAMTTRHVSRPRTDPGALGNAVCALLAGLLLSGAPVLAGTQGPEAVPQCALAVAGVALTMWGGAALWRLRTGRTGAHAERGGGR